MSDDQVAYEIQGSIDHQPIKLLHSYPSWISNIQRRMVSMNHQEIEQINRTKTQDIVSPITGTEQTPLCNSSRLTNSQQYFREDSGKNSVIAFDPTSLRYKTKPHEVIFRVDKFLKYLFIRILFTIIGPFILLKGFFNPNWFNFMRNIGVLGFKKYTLYNYFRFIQNYFFLFWLIFYGSRIEYCYYVIIFFLAYVMENVSTAIKFAFFHPSKLELIEIYDLAYIGDSCEQCLDPLQWAYQVQAMMDKELEQSVKRLQVETSSFVMFFMVKPEEEKQQRVAFKYPKEFEQPNYEFGGDGILMAKEIFQQFNQEYPFIYYIKVAIIISIVRTTLGLLLDILVAQKIDIALLVQTYILLLLYYIFILLFVFITLRDLIRKVFSLVQLSHLISAQKVELYEEAKIFPTLNLMCVVSLFSWVNLRKIVLDYGLQYTQRQTFILSFFIITDSIIMIVFIGLFYMGQVGLVAFIQFSIDFAIMSGFCLYAIIQGAKVNEQIVVHKGLLRKNLFIIQQISIQAFKNLEYSYTPQDYIFQALSDLMKQINESNVLQEGQLTNYLIFAGKSLEHVYNDLTYLEKNEPFEVIGIAMTYELVIQIGMSVVGLIGTAVLNMFIQT